MSDRFWLTPAQLDQMKSHIPLSHGLLRVDDRRVISGIICRGKRGLQWRDAPVENSPSEALCNRFMRWSGMGVFYKMIAGLDVGEGMPEQLQIDATHLKAHRTVASLLKKGLFSAVLAGPKVD